jgi:hypothetical protein
LRLDEFWLAALPPSREGTRWLNILKTLVSHQLISPGSEWRLQRHWFEHSAMGDLLGENIALAQPNNLYRCLDKLTAYCLLVTLKQRLKPLAPGLTARVVLEKLATMRMIDVELPTTDDRVVVLSRYTEPEKDLSLLLRQLKLQLPAQPPPKIMARNIQEVA